MRKMTKYLGTMVVALMLCLSMLVMSGTAIADRCVDNGDRTITDNGTGLMWQKTTAGKMDWGAGMGYCSNLSLAGHSDWGLPNKDELYGLYNSPCKDMMDGPLSYYWSSTPFASPTNPGALRVLFSNGHVLPSNKANSFYVRAVRGTQ